MLVAIRNHTVCVANHVAHVLTVLRVSTILNFDIGPQSFGDSITRISFDLGHVLLKQAAQGLPSKLVDKRKEVPKGSDLSKPANGRGRARNLSINSIPNLKYIMKSPNKDTSGKRCLRRS